KTNENTPEQAYEGSYFAYVDYTSFNKGNTSFFGSNTLFPAKKWCLRFRYFSFSADSYAVLTVVTYNNVTKEVKYHVNITRSDFEEWKYAEQNIQIENDFLLGFLATRGNRRLIFAIDDVTMIAGSCEESSTKLLHMKGEMKCNFEGGVDTCFNQDTSDDFDWTITRVSFYSLIHLIDIRTILGYAWTFSKA
ncbi:MAM domain-containing glycosylphosphatidylinositol anchor protein 2-like, partial [Saccostrea cucullata]|uniref:MAM domain-containing glycosylphosphatidylinositol anchor protein 2-like n=1 Tax=Saccostrea cuccullata TaxID=36930 RepID=UPI002ED440A8